MMVNVIALLVSIVISLSTPKASNGDGFKLTATVHGPYQGSVCFVIGDDEAEVVVAQGCFDEEVNVKDGEKVEMVKDFRVPLTAHPGKYRFMGILPDADENTISEVVTLTVE